MTSEAVLTELFHLIRSNRIDSDTAWRFVLGGAIALANIEHKELSTIQKLMNRYADRPMDFADATLVHLAERESLSTILTIDRADFATYRIGAKRRFDVLPASRN